MNPNASAFSEDIHSREVYGSAPLKYDTFLNALETYKMAFSIILNQKGFDADKFIQHVEEISQTPESYTKLEEYKKYDFIYNIKEHLTIERGTLSHNPEYIYWRYKYTYVSRRFDNFVTHINGLVGRFRHGMTVLVAEILRRFGNNTNTTAFYLFMTIIHIKLTTENDIPFVHVYTPLTSEILMADFAKHDEILVLLNELVDEFKKKVLKGSFGAAVLDYFYYNTIKDDRVLPFVSRLKANFSETKQHDYSAQIPGVMGWHYTNGLTIDSILQIFKTAETMLEQCRSGHVFNEQRVITCICMIEMHMWNVTKKYKGRYYRT